VSKSTQGSRAHLALSEHRLVLSARRPCPRTVDLHNAKHGLLFLHWHRDNRELFLSSGASEGGKPGVFQGMLMVASRSLDSELEGEGFPMNI